MCCKFWNDCVCNDRYYIINSLSWCIPLYLFFLSFMLMTFDYTFGIFIFVMSVVMLSLRTYTQFYVDNNDD